MPMLQTFLQDDQDMPDEPLSIVSPAQATETSLNRTWNLRPAEQARRMIAQPAWKTQLQRTQPGSTLLAPVMEEDVDSTSVAASMWSPPESYQSSTSTQRQADLARDAQDEADDLVSESEWEEHWRTQAEQMY